MLDYGWGEPIRDTLFDNFNMMADKASKSNSVVFQGTVGHHFADEVLSWHNVNGLDGERVLPAILITTKHPNEFRDLHRANGNQNNHKLLLIPIKEVCKTATDVVELIQKIFDDIDSKKSLDDFSISRKIKADSSKSIVDALILEPNAFGIGVDLKKIINFFKPKSKSR